MAMLTSQAAPAIPAATATLVGMAVATVTPAAMVAETALAAMVVEMGGTTNVARSLLNSCHVSEIGNYNANSNSRRRASARDPDQERSYVGWPRS